MTEVSTTHGLKPPESDQASALRLLPWMNLEGRPAYLSTNGGFLSGLADEIEELQLGSAVDVFDAVHGVLDNPHASPEELRFAARRLHESLGDTLRVALSRGLRGLSPTGEVAPVVVERWAYNPQSVGEARHELRRALEAWGLDALAETAELVLSELLTNAVRHARPSLEGEIETRYERGEGGVRIEVHDANETWPLLQKPSEEGESGRGLALVDALTASRWGVSEREGAGKLVWAIVADAGADEPFAVAG
ncbi:ATP-binding protein [Streptomyces polygonati]|uniref:ATP-binding protein n=1 Tax=Streptomyces polygonati TaxID=1617087 RepID=A0ABV8HPX2_9ACTN